MHKIQSIALYPRESGAVTLARRHASYGRPIGNDWPLLPAGEVVTVDDTQGWSWQVELSEPITDGGAAATVAGTVIGERTPLPMPEPTLDAGKYYIRLPNMSGHAHVRSWRAGDIVRLHGSVWKVSGKPKPNQSESQITYCLVTASEDDWATRPGRVSFSSEYAARTALGTAVQTPAGEWMHVKKLTKRGYGSAEGELFGHIYIGHGRHVAAEKAAKLNEKHPPNRLAKALDEGEGQGRDWSTPSGARTIAREPSGGSYASMPYMVEAGGVVYHVRPVYDDSPSVTRLRLTPKQAAALAKALGWQL